MSDQCQDTLRCDPGELDELYRRLRESMMRYLAI